MLTLMLERTYGSQDCSIARALEVVGERWTLLIVRDALLGSSRFGEFVASLDIATNVLATRLRLLVAEGILDYVADASAPGRSRYLLTDKGRALGPVLIALMRWGDAYGGDAGPGRRSALHRDCGGRVDAVPRCSCGDHPAASEIVFATRTAP
jgi:DNA-binding HxlR family transcriptional regulator